MSQIPSLHCICLSMTALGNNQLVLSSQFTHFGRGVGKMVWGNIKNVLLDAFFCDVLKLWSIKIEGDSTTFAGLNKFVKFFPSLSTDKLIAMSKSSKTNFSMRIELTFVYLLINRGYCKAFSFQGRSWWRAVTR